MKRRRLSGPTISPGWLRHAYDLPCRFSRYNARNFRPLLYAKLALLMMCLASAAAPLNKNSPSLPSEYHAHQLKAAAIHQFLFYTEWPQGTSSQGPLVVGFLDADDVELAFDAVIGEVIGGRTLQAHHISRDPNIEELEQCSILYISASAHKKYEDVLGTVAGHAILTISDRPGFLEEGGMINILVRDSRITFEINHAASKKAGITLRAKLLRLAFRVVRDDD